MRSTITCTACSTVLGVPKAGMPKEGLSCNWCGYINTETPEPVAPAPASTRSQPKPEVASVSAEAPANPASEPKVAPHRWADDEDDNGQPYMLPHEEVKTRPCTQCGKKIALKAVICVHCGFDEEAGKKVERTFQPIDLSWESGWERSTRVAIFLLFQGLNLFSLIVGLVSGSSLPGSIVGIAFYVGIQAFLVGTYDTLRIRRNKKGQTEMTVTWRIAFIPLAPKKLNWREHEGVAFGHYDAANIFDWLMAIFLLPMFILPAILWWVFVIRPDRFYAALARDRGFPATYLYRGTKEAQAKEIVQIATDATGLPLVTPI